MLSILDSEIVKQGFETVMGGETSVGQIILDAGPGRVFDTNRYLVMSNYEYRRNRHYTPVFYLFDYLYENFQYMKLPKFILNRTDDYLHHSKKWMIGHALLFYVASIFCFVALQMLCSYIYGLFGVSPESLTKFGGDPQYQMQKKSTLEFLLSVLLVAPLCEEVIFRLGISLKRNAVALWVAIAPAILIWYLISKNYIIVGVALVIGLLVGAYIFFRTDDSLWDKIRAKLSLAVVWISALTFGLLHLNAFTDMSWVILPYALCICVWPFLGGCAITYLRMNMGFFAGLIMHIFVNLPGVIGSLLMSM